MNHTVEIPTTSLPSLVEAIEKFNRRADRYGLIPAGIATVAPSTFDLRHLGLSGKINCYEVEVADASFVIPEAVEYDLLGIIKSDADLITVHSFIEDDDLTLNQYVDRHGECDHCKQDRRRTATYILRHKDSGDMKFIGSSCVKDFTGYDLTNAMGAITLNSTLNRILENLRESDEYFTGASAYAYLLDTMDIFKLTSAVIRQHGYVSYSAVEGTNSNWTTNRVRESILDRKNNPFTITDTDVSLAERTAEYALAQSKLTGNDFHYNWTQVAIQDLVKWEHLGLAVWAVEATRRAENEMKIQQAQGIAPSEFVGQVGDKLNPAVTVTACHSFESFYGMMNIWTMQDSDGNVYVWKTSSSSNANHNLDKALENKTVLQIKGTVKAHSEFRNVKQTELTRVKITG